MREETGNYNLGADHMNAQDNKSRKRKEKRLLKYLPQTARYEGARLQGLSRARSESVWREGVGGDRNETGEALTPYPSC